MAWAGLYASIGVRGVTDDYVPIPLHGDLKAKRSPLEITDPLALHEKPIPERRWLVPSWIPLRNVTMLGGDGGVGKSLVAMQLMTACAIGAGWLGVETMPCKVLGFFCEDEADELHRRQDDINRHYGVEFADLGDMQWIERVGFDNLLNGPTRDEGLQPTELYGRLMDQAVGFGAQLVIIDSLHDVFGGNENYRGDARQFIGLLRQLATEIDGAVVLTAHPSLSGRNTGTGEAGSTAWNNAVRSRLYLHNDEEQDDDVRLLTRKKANYAARDDDFRLTWRNGVFEAEPRATALVEGIVKRSADETFLSALDLLTKRGVEVNDSRQSHYAPQIMMGLKETVGLKRRDLERAMMRLISDGRIEIETSGPEYRRRRKFVRPRDLQVPC